MATAALRAPRARTATHTAQVSVDIGLLGFGTIGSAVAELAARSPSASRLRVTAALVRDVARRRSPATVRLVTDPAALLDSPLDVLVEVLGGVEPARTLVTAALEQRIPVVTANKSLVAACGDDLLELAARRATPFLYEASVLAGVPCLGTFGRRPHAAAASQITGIVNGTSNYILGQMETTGADSEAALGNAQRLGLAEPDPRNDVLGIDAAEKLVILARHFRLGSFRLSDVETTPITVLQTSDFAAAAELGGVIKPVVHAAHEATGASAFSGPAFVPAQHTLARITGPDNAIVIRNACGDLVYAGPGAGPRPTAATILDDVEDAARGIGGDPFVKTPSVHVQATATPWLVRVSASSMPAGEALADLLASYGIWVRRTADLGRIDGQPARYLLTYRCTRERIDSALSAVRAACPAKAGAIRALEC
jgi:homoserine dehydrogenase